MNFKPGQNVARKLSGTLRINSAQSKKCGIAKGTSFAKLTRSNKNVT